MPTLKQLINRYILFVTIILIILSTMVVSYIQLLITRNQVHNEAFLAISQIEHIMKENEEGTVPAKIVPVSSKIWISSISKLFANVCNSSTSYKISGLRSIK